MNAAFIVFVGLTIINSTEVRFEVIEKKGILAKNSNGTQTIICMHELYELYNLQGTLGLPIHNNLRLELKMHELHIITKSD